MKSVVVVGSRLLDPTQTQHAVFVRSMEDFRFLLVSKRRGDHYGRLQQLPCNARWISSSGFNTELLEEVSLVHVLTGGRIAHHAVSMAHRHGIPAIVSFHGGKDLTNTVHDPVWVEEYRQLFEKAALVTAPSEEAVAVLAAKGASPDRTRVVPPSVEIPPITAELDARTIPLLFAGRWLVRKRSHLAVEIAARVASNVVTKRLLHMVGEGPQWVVVDETLRRTSMSGRVRLHGYVPHCLLLALLQKTRVVLFTSRPGGDVFPPFLLEAQAAGAVVVAIGGPDSRDALASPTLRCSSVSEAASCCQGLLTDEAAWLLASQRAREYVAERFSLGRGLTRLRGLYYELL